MRIVLDAMGSDTHPKPEIKAAVEAARLWGDRILLSGPEHILLPELDEIGTTKDEVEVIHAPEVLEMTDKPAATARGKAMNSMAIGMDLVKEGEADAFVTAGNTGGAMANALFRLGRIRGVKRPALSPIIPVLGGHAVILDVGANADCKPIFLLQFAIMGTIYAEKVLGKSSPRVGLLSNGEEPGKGNMLVKETFPLLETAGINFIGNVEPKEVYAGEADVVVTDGFSGNVFIKTSEAVARFMIDIIRDEIKASPISSVGGLLAKPAFRRVGLILDPSEYGAAPLLGVDGLVFIGHGRSDA
ncbi:MAG: phosphate acyltransferase PlsX, partial [Anaerolineales bacterium]|nr:phosphate acyltransferase PlsX [Anaerolineales bacterium]